tara:strand:+ start:3831 stop:5177 length:1347 start_codon:yes stop_codon:yes gene_type:complete
MKHLVCWLFLLSFLAGKAQILSESQIEAKQLSALKDQSNAISSQLIEALNGNDYNKMEVLFSPKLKEALTEKKIFGLWQSLNEQHNGFEKTLNFKIKLTAEHTYLLAGILFQDETKLDLQYTLNEENEVNSLRIIPYSNPNEWNPPSYSVLDQIETKAIKIGTNSPLLAELVSPASKKSSSIVIMVHGSGPNDMDESLGPNKLFKDLAYGLATNGISSIRYNKRSFDYQNDMAKRMNEIDFNDIVVNDARIAIKEAKSLGYQKVFLLGHSLGGHLAPRIVDGLSLSGVIIMAGNSSPLQDLLLPQFEYLMENDPNTPITEFQLNILKTQIDNLAKGEFDENTVGPLLPLSLPGKFWLSLKDYNPIKTARSHDFPYLILNGDRDYQVTVDEANQWKNGSKHEKSQTIIYKDLNHMFYAGEGLCIPSEYEEKHEMNVAVLKDISSWIKSL